MRKRTFIPETSDPSSEFSNEQWLDLAAVAEVEVTSEAQSHPIESALVGGGEGGWRAAGPGEQRIRLIFDNPQRLTRVLLLFEEHGVARSHEFVLRWSPNVDGPYTEIVRQQWNFSPPDTVRELEDYRLQLSNVTVLELIISHISGPDPIASLMKLRIA